MNQTQNNTKIKCLITDFDETFFRTAIVADLKKTKPIDWDKINSSFIVRFVYWICLVILLRPGDVTEISDL